MADDLWQMMNGVGGVLTKDQEYPLHAAVREGRLDDLKILLETRQCDINKGTFEMVRPLHEACLAGNYDCTALLIEYGADINLQNYDGATALCDACSNGNAEIVKLLLRSGAIVNPPFLMTTPAHEAVLRDNWECLELLIQHGALLDKSDLHYGTPLHVAAFKSHIKSAEVLLKAGASPNVAKTHQTPLHEAARSSDIRLIKLLLEHGANVYTCNSRGLSASQLVPSSTSPCKVYLQDWECTPKTLSFHCRQVICKTVGTTNLDNLKHLSLPKSLIRYLQFDEMPAN